MNMTSGTVRKPAATASGGAAAHRGSRHALLAEIGAQGQERISALSVLVIGAGGVGCPAALYLVESGICSITLLDADKVEASNLARQILHLPDRIGMNKAASAKETLSRINPDVKVEGFDVWADEKTIRAHAANADIILDCSDNFRTRHAANRAALALGKPLVTVSAIRFSLQVAFFDFSRSDCGCYACMFPDDEDAASDVKASSVGVLAPVTGLAGLIAAEEVLKWAAGADSLAGRLLMLDTLSWQIQTFKIAKMPGCAACAGCKACAD